MKWVRRTRRYRRPEERRHNRYDILITVMVVHMNTKKLKIQRIYTYLTPASSTRTVVLASSVSRFANTRPAFPAVLISVKLCVLK